jgi:hypothetical protein
MSTTSTPVQAPPRSSGRAWLWLGIAVGLLAPAAYAAQLYVLHRLKSPWYVPILGTVGAAFVLFALTRRRGVGRIVAAVLLVALAAGQWAFLLALSKTPPYAGPLEVGKPFPPFATKLSDGSTFNQDDLKGGQPTVMVFFRGRW